MLIYYIETKLKHVWDFHNVEIVDCNGRGHIEWSVVSSVAQEDVPSVFRMEMKVTVTGSFAVCAATCSAT
jgi:hypothetical protein